MYKSKIIICVFSLHGRWHGAAPILVVSVSGIGATVLLYG